MPKRTGRPWQRVKARIIRRDAGICHLCGQPGANTADHLVPVARGGAVYDLDNLAAAHIACNRKRGSRSVVVAREEIAQQVAIESTGVGWQW